jgi:hypothetical protein
MLKAEVKRKSSKMAGFLMFSISRYEETPRLRLLQRQEVTHVLGGSVLA